MAMSPDSSSADLQFDTVVPGGSTFAEATADKPSGLSLNTSAGVVCRSCGATLTDEYYDVNSVSVCDSCRTRLEAMAGPLQAWGPFVRAILFGVGAAIVGAVLYYAVIAIANLEIGIVAIAIGYMVGYAIRRATGGRGGRRLQILAVALTYWSVGLAYTPLAFKELAQQEKSTASTAESTQTSDRPMSGGRLVVALAAVAALTLALPVLSVFGALPGGLITALIMFFGMSQAWRMTAAPRLVISGPFRIGATPDTPAVSS